MITNLTPEQKALIPVYRQKWSAIAFSDQPIDRNKATTAIEAVCAALKVEKPPIYFVTDMCAAWNLILSKLERSQLCSVVTDKAWTLADSIVVNGHSDDTPFCVVMELESKLHEELNSRLDSCFDRGLGSSLVDKLQSQQEKLLESQLGDELRKEVKMLLNREREEQGCWKQLNNELRVHTKILRESQQQNLPTSSFCGTAAIRDLDRNLQICLGRKLLRNPMNIVDFSSYLDFCFSVLNCVGDSEGWFLFQSLAQACGCIFFFDKICVICERPIIPRV